MLLFKQLLALKQRPHSLDNEYKRKYHLIQAVSFELFILNFFLMSLCIYFNFYLITYLLLANGLIVLFNLILLRNNNNLRLCSHIINILCFLMITASNLWLGEASLTLDWFYIAPIIAAITIGIDGLLIYGALSGMMMTTLLACSFPPIHLISSQTLIIISYINPIFIFLLVGTFLYHLLIENKLFESLLKEQNFLLSADKKKFHYLSHHDFLTNLPNRSFFYSHLQELLYKMKENHSTITLFFMDLDDFKKINDLYGHEAGDALLLQASKRLQSCFRDGDFLARLGGDEFTAIIQHSLRDNFSFIVMERIKKEFKEPFLIKGHLLKCFISVGKASCPADGQTVEALLKSADESMYKNKRRKQTTTA